MRGKYRDRTKATEKVLNLERTPRTHCKGGFGQVNGHVWQELRLCGVEEEAVSWKGSRTQGLAALEPRQGIQTTHHGPLGN